MFLGDVNVPLKLIELLQTDLCIGADRVWLYNERRAIPTDTKMWMVLEYVAGPQYGNTLKYCTIDGVYSTVQAAYSTDLYTLMIGSYTDSKGQIEAFDRKEEVAFALGGNLAQQYQEKYAFRIGTLSDPFDASVDDGAGVLTRYGYRFTAMVCHQRIKPVNYYDDFSSTIPPKVILTNP